MNETIGIIGLGKLGLCLALNLERAGFGVIGTDTNSQRLIDIENKTVETTEPQVVDLLENSQNFETHANLSYIVKHCAIIFVIVPTPSLENGAFDHSVINALISDLKTLGKPKVPKTLVINSTTMPGYCESIASELADLNYALVYNPEFIAQGSIIHDQRNPDQVLIGSEDENAGAQIQAVYQQMCDNNPAYHIMDLTSAEITKLATNCYLTMKISFANHIGDLAIKAGADHDKILDCIGSDKRIGNKYLGYGFGYGGPCFPRDNKALMHFGEELDHTLYLSEATDRVNEDHLNFQYRMLKNAKRPEYYFDDVAYKPGTDIIEESQQLRLAVRLAKSGARVRVKASASMKKQLEANYGNILEFETS